LKCMTDVGSTDMCTVNVAIVTVRSGVSSISAGGMQFKLAVGNYLRI
jgi:hypothetical protein